MDFSLVWLMNMVRIAGPRIKEAWPHILKMAEEGEHVLRILKTGENISHAFGDANDEELQAFAAMPELAEIDAGEVQYVASVLSGRAA